MKNQISIFDLIVLQFLWVCQSICESFLSIFNWKLSIEAPTRVQTPKEFKGKRHFIRLFTREPSEIGEKPICYIQVTEIDGEEHRNRHHQFPYRTVQRVNGPDINDLQRFFCGNLRY
ncbi:hypothetical protein GWI33_015242 [Rhynchophorus ferrugineus]|uniref:Uncharacterized protein n=1 Tax=Rhynchophorus ferrugineus TaxID=354439 RepID=A0A834I136_RHYFE|nr:hypothetical protein GWI33_015242 [Rhynchophorus ferrugineus]